MSSYLLLKKLVSTSVDTDSIMKVKKKIEIVTAEKQAATNALRRLLHNDRKKYMCRLCLNPAKKHNIFDRDHKVNILTHIQYALGIEILKNDSKPQYICTMCLRTLKLAVNLKLTAEATQWRLEQEVELLSEMDQGSTTLSNEKLDGGYFKRYERQDNIVREWRCGKCKRPFKVEEEYIEHTKMKSCTTRTRGDTTCICEVCGKKCNTKTQYTAHRSTHQPVLRYACTLCPYRARTAAALTFHMRVHTGERPVQCPYCPQTFARPSNLTSHKRRHFPPQHYCHTCDRYFTMKQSLERHMMTQHSNMKPHTCSTCGKAFAVRKFLRRHELKTHNRPKLRGGTIPTYILLQQQEEAEAASGQSANINS